MSDASRSSSTPPECQKCGMGMLVATKEQFAARICGSCERSSTPPESLSDILSEMRALTAMSTSFPEIERAIALDFIPRIEALFAHLTPNVTPPHPITVTATRGALNEPTEASQRLNPYDWPEGIERLAEAVHEAYLTTCARLKWDVKPANKVPYSELSEDSKELDRASVRAVLQNLSSPVPAPEDTGEMLDALIQAAKEWEWGRMRPDDALVPDTEANLVAARSEILSLVSRLRSQVETLREHAQIDATMHRNCCRERASLEQRTLIPDEKAGVIAVLQQTIRDCATLRMSPPPHIKAALRRLSSDSETGDTK